MAPSFWSRVTTIHLFTYLKETSAKLTKLRLGLSEYNFTIEHIKGTENVIADALSRIHIDEIRSAAIKEKDLEKHRILVKTRSMTRIIIDQKVQMLEEPTVMHNAHAH